MENFEEILKRDLHQSLLSMKEMRIITFTILAVFVCCPLVSSLANARNLMPADTSVDNRPEVLTKEELTACEKSLLAEWK